MYPSLVELFCFESKTLWNIRNGEVVIRRPERSLYFRPERHVVYLAPVRMRIVCINGPVEAMVFFFLVCFRFFRFSFAPSCIYSSPKPANMPPVVCHQFLAGTEKKNGRKSWPFCFVIVFGICFCFLATLVRAVWLCSGYDISVSPSSYSSSLTDWLPMRHLFLHFSDSYMLPCPWHRYSM